MDGQFHPALSVSGPVLELGPDVLDPDVDVVSVCVPPVVVVVPELVDDSLVVPVDAPSVAAPSGSS